MNPSLEEMNVINNEIYSRVPNQKQVLHDLASAINLLIAGHYYEAYDTYLRYSVVTKKVDLEEQFKVMMISSNELIKQKEYEKAQIILVKAREIYGNDSSILNNLSVVLFKLNKRDEAVSLLEESLKEVPDNPEMNRNYKKILQFLHRIKEE